MTAVKLRIGSSDVLDPSYVEDELFAEGSGLGRLPPPDESNAAVLNSELGTVMEVAALVFSAVSAAESLYTLITAVRKTGTDRPRHSGTTINISIVVNDTEYDLADASREELERLLSR